jgi:hypothetical protein
MRPVISWRRPRAARRVDHPRTRLKDSAGPKKASVITATDILGDEFVDLLGGARVNLDGARKARALVQAGQAGAAGLHPAVTRLEYREQAEGQESERHGC